MNLDQLVIGARATNMWKSPLAKMLSMYILAACVLGATYATAIEYPKPNKREPPFSINVKPKYWVMHRGESVTIKCRAKRGYEVSDIPMISFYRRLRDKRTVMPLSSASYGVTIRATSDHPSQNIRHRSRKQRMRSFRKSSKLLHLDKAIYNVLDYGPNDFYCRAASIEGHRTDELFILYKV